MPPLKLLRLQRSAVAKRQVVCLVRMYRAGLCMWEKLEIGWGVLEWIARNPSARQGPCLVHLCWCDGCNGAVCIFGDVVREERRFPIFNAKCWSAAVASGEHRSSTGSLGRRDPCRSEC